MKFSFLFIDDIGVIDKINEDINQKFKLWRHILQSKNYKISRSN